MAPRSSVESLQLLSYNIFMRPPLVCNKRGDYKDERLDEFIKELPKFDVVALQEIFRFATNRQSRLIKEAASAGLRYHTAAPMHFIDGGLLILSRFPILSSSFKPFSRGVYADRFCQKGVLQATIRLEENGSLEIFCTHLQSSPSSQCSVADMQIRKEQLLVLYEAASAARELNPDHTLIIMGDLNIDATKKYSDWKSLEALFIGDWVHANSAAGATYGVQAREPEVSHNNLVDRKDQESDQAIDHVLIRDDMKRFKFKACINQMKSNGNPRFTHLSGICGFLLPG